MTERDKKNCETIAKKLPEATELQKCSIIAYTEGLLQGIEIGKKSVEAKEAEKADAAETKEKKENR